MDLSLRDGHYQQLQAADLEARLQAQLEALRDTVTVAASIDQRAR